MAFPLSSLGSGIKSSVRQDSGLGCYRLLMQSDGVPVMTRNKLRDARLVSDEYTDRCRITVAYQMTQSGVKWHIRSNPIALGDRLRR